MTDLYLLNSGHCGNMERQLPSAVASYNLCECFFASAALSHLLVACASCHSFFTTVRSVLTIAEFHATGWCI